MVRVIIAEDSVPVLYGRLLRFIQILTRFLADSYSGEEACSVAGSINAKGELIWPEGKWVPMPDIVVVRVVGSIFRVIGSSKSRFIFRMRIQQDRRVSPSFAYKTDEPSPCLLKPNRSVPYRGLNE